MEILAQSNFTNGWLFRSLRRQPRFAAAFPFRVRCFELLEDRHMLTVTVETLHSFSDNDGQVPEAGLTLVGSTFFGTTAQGGSGGGGTVYSMNTDGSNLQVLHSFSGSDGIMPTGDLTLVGSTLFGTTVHGGNGNGDGTIFSINTDGSGFQVLHSLSGTDGTQPNDNLTVIGSTLFGTTGSGGTHGDGTIFSMNIGGSGFQVLHPFSGTDGSAPMGDLTLVGSTFFGTTSTGGNSDLGTVFSMNTDGSDFQMLHSLSGADGNSPSGNLTLVGSTLFGTASGAVGNGDGTIFSIDTDGNNFHVLHSFAGTDGSDPVAGLTLAGSALFGTTNNDGSGGFGTIFSINPDGSDFQTVHPFSVADGSGPAASLSLVGTTLFGTTDSGGSGDGGTVFSVTGAVPILEVTTSSGADTYTVGGPAVVVDSGVTVFSASDHLTDAAVGISSGTLQAGDMLNFTNQNNITGNYDAATGLLTLNGTATAAQYEAALRSVTFSSTSTSTTTRQIGFEAIDGASEDISGSKQVNVLLPSPQLSVTGNNQPIADGSTTPNAANDTALGSTLLGGSPLSETYTITNSGTAPLTVGTVAIGGTNAGDFTVTHQPASSVAVGGSTTFTVQFAPTAAGTRAATVSFTENDPSQTSPFTFAIDGVATTQANIVVTGNNQPIADGSITTNATNNTALGSTLLGGSPLSQTYTITNSGTAPLTLGTVAIGGTNAGDFTVTHQPASSVAIGGSTTFTVQFAPTAAGTRAATVSFTENDPSQSSPFTFAIGGVATTQANITVTGNNQPIADGSTTPSATNDTVLGSTLLGGSPLSQTYTIANSGTAPLTLGTVAIGGTNAGDFQVIHQPASSVAIGGSTTFTVQFAPTAAGTRAATVSFTENDPSQSSPFTFAIGGVATTQAHIAVTGNSQPIADGSTTTSASNNTALGSTLLGGSPVSQTYTIANSGTAALTLGTVSIAGTNAGDFTVTHQPASSVAVGGSTTFTVQFAPTAAGTRAATVSFTENDPSQSSPFTFAIGGVAATQANTGIPQPGQFGFISQPNVPPPPLMIGPKIAQPTIPLAVTLAVTEMPNVPPARLAAIASIFNFDAGGGVLPTVAAPPWQNYDPGDDEIFYQSAAMPEQNGHDIVLALALSIVPEVGGSEVSDERPDPQKLPNLAALEIALPELLAPEGDLEGDSTQSWWIAGSAGAVLACSLAILLTPRALRKKSLGNLIGRSWSRRES
jgi:uncharacterized repeat protein (TIGR03803 family)